MHQSRGIFVCIDGPCGVGKTTTVQALGNRLRSVGLPIHLTAEPTNHDIGTLARARVHTDTSGHALACLFAADRYERLHTEIRPRLAAGDIVVSDRYVAAGLVMQRLDGVDLDFLRAINASADPPDLAVILTANPAVITQRLAQRGRHNRYQYSPDISADETALYIDAADSLSATGVPVLRLETSLYPPDTLATMIHTRIDALRNDRHARPDTQAAS
ncbi:dTMP kinase [Haloechinothrix salitolerans]|uniref:Thymidylate kinase n=1 Tax=Haloechinothrix salitolerans TaxID=926830 RepID=A0ABW2BXW1_9PSEU